MRHYLFFLIFTCMITSAKTQPAEALAAFEAHTFTSADKQDLPYRVLWPEGYDNDSAHSFPLILFLHGAGERGDDNRLQLTHGTPLFLSEENRRQFPAIVVMPQCAEEDYWAQMAKAEDGTRQYNFNEEANPSLQAVSELLDHFLSNEKVDPNRVYLMGLSMGGMGTFELLARRPDTFAAAIPICGGTNPALLPIYARQVPMWIFHGGLDPVVTVDDSRRVVNRLEDLSIPVKYTEYEGVYHDSWNNAFDEPELLSWLFAHSRRP